ncbi:hypothetical protein [Ruminiclostridium cellulolyticum]|uniref:Dienelactone hydrolase domain-containing protein n=1 Tax=Ruminiclostridium cellulolyticum (strain ATCC 35319 / DSM 5812 / JCM 6584 / H10) TaxID=394503 RepID=B8I539_RUMCH|nr:hypothetical protein [Ruminiclostridium cellulolyticum]ACL74619.1 hypothetical protein Ccel_0232 [Ruminiclostridium cellulolyticum H10]
MLSIYNNSEDLIILIHEIYGINPFILDTANRFALYGVIFCYGSRIRDYTDISPSCPALLLFPSHEKSFNVRGFVSSFKKPGVEVHTLEGNHGFADSYSSEYNKSSAQKTFALIDDFLKENSSGS